MIHSFFCFLYLCVFFWFKSTIILKTMMMIHAFSIQPMIFKQFLKKGSMLIRVVIFSKKILSPLFCSSDGIFFSLGEKG